MGLGSYTKQKQIKKATEGVGLNTQKMNDTLRLLVTEQQRTNHLLQKILDKA